MKKLVFLISSLADEGPTRILLNIIHNLDLSIFDVTVVTLVAEKNGSIKSRFDNVGVRLVLECRFEGGGADGYLGKYLALRKYLRKSEVNVVHAHCPRSLIFIAGLRFMRVKRIYTAHIYPGIQTIALYGPVKGRAIAWVSKVLYRFVDKVVACSKSVSDEFLKNDNLLIDYINNGIEGYEPVKSCSERSMLREALGMSDGRIYLIFVGRMSAEKRPVLMAESYLFLDRDKFGLLMLGDGPELENLKSDVKYAGIRFEGFKTNIRDYLVAADIYVSTSATEGLPNSLLEAMSVGLPVILSDIPSHAMVVSGAYAKFGELTEFKSGSNFVSLVCNMVNSLPEYRYNSRKEFFDKYLAIDMAKRYAKEYGDFK